MDVLSDMITAMRTGSPHARRTVHPGPWRERCQPVAGIGVHMVRRGRCELLRRDGTRLPLREGDVVCTMRRLGEYTLAGAADTVLLCGAYLLEPARPHPVLAEFPALVHLPAHDQHAALSATIGQLDGELASPELGGRVAVAALLDQLLVYVVRASCDGRRHTASGWAAALTDPAISAALSAIHERPERMWTVKQLGACGGLSRAAFARRFTALVGRPPLAYLTWWRMMIAARLLRDDDAPLATIAARTGYTSEFAFGKAFKREYGSTPGEYRRSA